MRRATLGRSTVKFIALPAELGRSADFHFHPKAPIRDVPYVPTPERVVTTMLDVAGVNDRDILYDLGCGDGRIVIAAAKERGARGVGIDIDPERIKQCEINSVNADVVDRVRFEVSSVFEVDVSPATVVALYLLPWMNAQLRPKLLAELKPGARIVAHQFPIANWPPDRVVKLPDNDRVVYGWVVPAHVAGRWQCTLRTADGVLRRGSLELEQELQTVVGAATLSGRETPLENLRLSGCALSFSVHGVLYNCHVDGEGLRGAGHCANRRGQLEIRARRI